MVTTKQNLRVNEQKIKKRETEHTNMKITILQRWAETEGKRKNGYKTSRKQLMALVSPYISIISLSVNGYNLTIKNHRMAGWIFF